MKLIDEVMYLDIDGLRKYIKRRAMHIATNTQTEDWYDPEEWQVSAAELAHAVVRLFEIAGV